MSHYGSNSRIASVDGVSVARSVNKSSDDGADGATLRDPTLPAANAIAAEDFTNNGDSTATAELSAGHTLVTGVADLYWAAGIRYGCTVTVGGYDGNTATISGGAGDALPATSTACTIANQVSIDCPIDGDNAQIVGVGATRRCHVDFQDVSNATVRQIEVLADEPDCWDSDEATNPWTGNPITHAHASCGESAGSALLTIVALVDATP